MAEGHGVGEAAHLISAKMQREKYKKRPETRHTLQRFATMTYLLQPGPTS
jgi:hypothetical protein